MKKIAIVVQRFGKDIMGGAERHAFLLAKGLKSFFDVTVLTTCASDYSSWKNVYQAGTTIEDGISVVRFKVDFERNKRRFDGISEEVFQSGIFEMEELWMKEQGPYSTDLLNFLRDNDGEYDGVIFFTYLYASTVFGFRQIHKSKKILIPTAHDEKPIYLSIFKDVFKKADAIVFNTDSEKLFVNDLFQNSEIQNIVAGIFVQLPVDYKPKFVQESDFMLYVGRIDENKGVRELFDFHSKLSEKKNLVLAGSKLLKIPNSVVYKGEINEEEKFDLINSSDFLVIPSKFESLSMLLLEAFLCEKPVLVNGNCNVLKEHCLRSNAGLWYHDFESFSEAIQWFNMNKDSACQMGKNGKKYFDENYSKKIVEEKIVKFLNSVL